MLVVRYLGMYCFKVCTGQFLDSRDCNMVLDLAADDRLSICYSFFTKYYYYYTEKWKLSDYNFKYYNFKWKHSYIFCITPHQTVFGLLSVLALSEI